MRVDAHQHFWEYTPEEYPWMDEPLSLLKRHFLPPDLLPELVKAGLDGTVAVQARQSLEESRWLLELSDQYPAILGVVGWVDLCCQRRRPIGEVSDPSEICRGASRGSG